MIKFEKIKPGMLLWQRGRARDVMRSYAEWSVRIIEVDSEHRRALVSWNTNKPEWWHEYRLSKLYTKRKTQGEQ